MIYEIGKTYDVTHSRKGKFTLRITDQCDEWVTGIILDGKAEAIMDYNEKFPGESITARKSFITRADLVSVSRGTTQGAGQ